MNFHKGQILTFKDGRRAEVLRIEGDWERGNWVEACRVVIVYIDEHGNRKQRKDWPGEDTLNSDFAYLEERLA